MKYIVGTGPVSYTDVDTLDEAIEAAQDICRDCGNAAIGTLIYGSLLSADTDYVSAFCATHLIDAAVSIEASLSDEVF